MAYLLIVLVKIYFYLSWRAVVNIIATVTTVRQFLIEAKAELKKVTWPTRKQAVDSTAVVISVVAIIALFLSLIDFGLAKIIKLILG